MNPVKDINTYLREQDSPLAGKGAVFVREARKNGLDPKLLVAIAGAESSFGKNIKPGTYNPFGWGPHIPFKSWDQAISTVARGLRKGYLDEGLKTIGQIGAKWAPAGAANDPTNLNSNWARNVGRFYAQLGGQGVATKPSVTVAPSLTPAPTLTTPALPTNGPDLAGLALSNLAAISAGGRQQSPLDMLSGLTTAVASTPPPTAPQAPAAPLPTQTPALPQGTLPVQAQTSGGTSLDQRLASFGLADAVTSGDRPGAVTARGGSSDHGRKGKARDINPRDPDFPRLVAHARANPGAYKDFIYAGLPWFIDEGRLYPIGQLNKTDRDNHRSHAHISIR